MANTQQKRHLYYDQQRPTEEPRDAEHTPLTPAMFARREPSSEDEYFAKQDEQRRKISEEKLPHDQAAGTAEKPVSQPMPIWRRIIKTLTRHQ